MNGYVQFCYAPVLPGRSSNWSSLNPNFTIWVNGDFEPCFESLVVVSGSAALLGLTSALYAGSYHTKFRRRHKPPVLVIRALLSLCVLLTYLLELIASFWLSPWRPYSVLLSEAILVVSWASHVVCLWALSSSIRHSGRGPLTLHCSWILTLVASVFKFHTIISWILDPAKYMQFSPSVDRTYFSLLHQITTYVYFGLQVLYLLTLPFAVAVVTGENVVVSGRRVHLTAQYEDSNEQSITDHLLSPGWAGPTAQYGAVQVVPPRSHDLKAASEDGANPLSLLTFWWVGPLMSRGSRGYLRTPQDLPPLPRKLDTHHVRGVFRKAALNSQRQQTRRERSSNWRLVKDLNAAFGLHYYPLGVLKLLADMLGFAGPLLLHQLVAFIENQQEPMYHGYLYALGLFLSTLLGALLLTHFNYQVSKVGVKVRGALITEVYRKALAVSATTLSLFSTGQVVNFMSTDTDRIVNYCQSFHQFWSLPFQVLISLGLLYQQVGLAFLAGLVFCILLIPVNRWLAIKIGKLSTTMMAHKDSRVKVMSEVLTGIRVVKFYAWEDNFITKILGIRAEELKSLKGRKYLDALCVYFWATTPVLISILTFATYVAIGNTLTAAKVFTSVALFSILISPLNAFPWVINGLIEAWVSTKRVQAFLNLSEQGGYYCISGGHKSYPSKDQEDSTLRGQEDYPSGGQEDVVRISHGYFTWSRDIPPPTEDLPSQEGRGTRDSPPPSEDLSSIEGRGNWTLSNINLTIKSGQLVGVVGQVGSGKSSLLSAITAEIRKTQGEVSVASLSNGFGLAAQEAWIQHASVRDNILFGLPYNAEWYTQVIYACALEQDLQVLPAGDRTEVGENGVTLSGGQKARVALARAVYQDKEVYLLDDPLSTVDAHVGAHLFTHCIMGLLRHKTRVLATHHVRFLSEADLVVVMESGCVIASGPPARVLSAVTSEAGGAGDEGGVGDPSEKGEGMVTMETEQSQTADSADDVLVKEEEKEVGVVKFSVYRAYWTSVGHLLAPVIMLSLLLMQASRNVNDWWLAYWIAHSLNDSETGINLTSTSISSPFHQSLIPMSNSSVPILSLMGGADNLGFYLGIYGGLAAANSVFTLLRAFLYAYGGVRAATVIHRSLLRAIMSAPIAFFDVTPIGRIINRFSSDLYAIDDSLPFILNILLAQFYGILGTLVVTCYGLPWFALLLLPLALIYYHIQNYYRRTSRELKRLSTVTLSPVYAHFQESLVGVATVRALRASDRFQEENTQRLNLNQRANYGSFAVAQWLGIRLQMLGVAMVTGVAFIAVLEHHFNSVDPGLVGLAVSYALSVTNLLSGVVTSFTETEKEMVCVERAMQYVGGVPSEKVGRATTPPADWPSGGVVEFRQVKLVYREGLSAALKDLSLTTQPAEKLGVVGRTGAGKSSLFQALFRLTELSSGAVLIDGVDTSTLSLHTLRSVLAVIPQDPFLFSGSIRDNLDPCHKHSDAELWSALERCHLQASVLRLGGLDQEVQERGRVFSMGQRQLLCLARALLTRAKVICIDEATASVDMETDRHIQETIRREFTESTVITIAHRIETVLGCDRILVMDGGRLRELAPPTVLLDDHHSLFHKLYREHTQGRH